MQSWNESQMELLADMKTQMKKLEMSIRRSRAQESEMSSDDEQIVQVEN
jgi:hypothetical protein